MSLQVTLLDHVISWLCVYVLSILMCTKLEVHYSPFLPFSTLPLSLPLFSSLSSHPLSLLSFLSLFSPSLPPLSLPPSLLTLSPSSLSSLSSRPLSLLSPFLPLFSPSLPPLSLLALSPSSDMLHSIYHDHCYAKRPPPVTFKLRTTPRKGYVACINMHVSIYSFKSA